MADGEDVFDDLAPISGAPSPHELAKFDLNDNGNALRYVRQVGGGVTADGDVGDLKGASVLYLREHGWIAFNGRFWDLRGGESLAKRLATKVSKGLWAQAEILAAQEEKQAAAEGREPPKRLIASYYDFAEQSGNKGRIEAMLGLAKMYLEVDLDAFDQDPLALNVRNGVLRFRRKRDGKGKVIGHEVQFAEGHNPADRFTRMAEVDYDAEAEAPSFTAALREWQPVESIRNYLQLLLGYACTADTSEQIFIIFQGLGRDGKSTLMNLLRKLLGTYAATADVKTFLDMGQRSGGDASPDIARLAGDTRLVSTAEPPKNAKLADHMIKSFTGGGNVTTRRLKQDLFEFEPVAKVVMECNVRPQPQGIDDGIFRRLKLVLFENQLPLDKVDRELPGRLDAERSGILNWLIGGVCRWLVEGVKDPPRVKEALEDYRKGSSSFFEWVTECLVRDKNAEASASELMASYKEFILERDEKPMSQTAFGRALADLQIIRSKRDGMGRVMRSGARLKTSAERDADNRRDDAPDPDSGAGGPGGLGGSGGAFEFAPDEDDGEGPGQ